MIVGLRIAIPIWIIILLAYKLPCADGVLCGVIAYSETGKGAEGVPVEITHCHCSTKPYPYPKPFATATTLKHGGYDICLPDASYVVTPRPTDGKVVEPAEQIIEIKPCKY